MLEEIIWFLLRVRRPCMTCPHPLPALTSSHSLPLLTLLQPQRNPCWSSLTQCCSVLPQGLCTCHSGNSLQAPLPPPLPTSAHTQGFLISRSQLRWCFLRDFPWKITSPCFYQVPSRCVVSFIYESVSLWAGCFPLLGCELHGDRNVSALFPAVSPASSLRLWHV